MDAAFQQFREGKMNVSDKLRIMVLSLLLLMLPFLVTCGENDSITTIPMSELNMNSTSIFNTTYMGETNVWTRTVVGEEIYDGVDCYIAEMTPDKPLLRYGIDGEVSHYLLGYTLWTSKSSRLKARIDMHMESANGVKGDIQYVRTYGSDDHGMPFFVGKSWTYDASSEGYLLEFPVVTWKTEVTEIEDVAVPAGTFTCYKLESWKESVLGVEITPHEVTRTEWWSTDEEYFGIIKSQHIESPERVTNTEMVSYSP